ncbi:uncharacterized protein LOC126185213 [Schistocerca cancellata]|uniref:uncharacterized protein LOC126185213 n=1 Tax=Schistocerca cancellata TaxID=274614 RepID=UPI0021186023|nr:uncharacterized protein LOC126185213 [Schistocerca cancellata]
MSRLQRGAGTWAWRALRPPGRRARAIDTPRYAARLPAVAMYGYTPSRWRTPDLYAGRAHATAITAVAVPAGAAAATAVAVAAGEAVAAATTAVAVAAGAASATVVAVAAGAASATAVAVPAVTAAQSVFVPKGKA